MSGMKSPRAFLRRALGKLADNRVLAPKAYLIDGRAFLPPSALEAIKNGSVARTANYLGQIVGLPVYALPAALDKRDREDEWREGKRG